MMRIIFKVISESSGQEYELVAEFTGRGLRFRCNCVAGSLGQFCKHRQEIIAGVLPTTPTPSDAEVTMFKDWLAISRVGAMQDSIATAESDVKMAKKRAIMLKHELGRRLEEGTA